jgi:hypothetical protein
MRKGRVVTPTPARTLGALVSEGSTDELKGINRPAPPERHERTSTPTRRKARGLRETVMSLFVSQPILVPL